MCAFTCHDHGQCNNVERRQGCVSPRRHPIFVWAVLHTFSTRQFYLWQSTTSCRKIVLCAHKAEGERMNDERMKTPGGNRYKNEKNGEFHYKDWIHRKLCLFTFQSFGRRVCRTVLFAMYFCAHTLASFNSKANGWARSYSLFAGSVLLSIVKMPFARWSRLFFSNYKIFASKSSPKCSWMKLVERCAVGVLSLMSWP